MRAVVAALAVVFLASLAPSAHARIGETREQCIKRYGKPEMEADNKIGFITRHFVVEVSIDQTVGKCISIQYTTLNGEFSSEALTVLLYRNVKDPMEVFQKRPKADRMWWSRAGTVMALFHEHRGVFEVVDFGALGVPGIAVPPVNAQDLERF